MLRKVILWKLDSVERELGASLDYLRHMVRTSLRSFFKFGKLLPLSEHRRALPADAYHVAKIVAAREEDCGSCVQIAVNLARRDAVAADVVRAVVAADVEALPEELADVHRFTEMVVRATYDEGPLRDSLRARYGEEALVELALAIASGQVFPVTKRALGYATSCANVDLRV